MTTAQNTQGSVIPGFLISKGIKSPVPVRPEGYIFSKRDWLLNKKGSSPEIIFPDWQGKDQESWTFVGAHDDDMLIAQGLLIQYATAVGIKARIVVVTNGCEGWVRVKDKDDIVRIRKAETEKAYRWIGIKPDDMTWLGIPDMEIPNQLGKLQKDLIHIFIKEQSTRIIYGWGGDPHTDHMATANGVSIGAFHAQGGLHADGKSLKGPFHLYQTPVYIPAVNDYIRARRIRPDIQIEATLEAHYNYLRAIGEYVSQEQIAGLVTTRANGGPFEHLYENRYPFYDANVLRAYFEDGSLLLRLSALFRRSLRSEAEARKWSAVAAAALKKD